MIYFVRHILNKFKKRFNANKCLIENSFVFTFPDLKLQRDPDL